MICEAVRGRRIYHSTPFCPVRRRWHNRMQILITTTGMTHCKHCQRMWEKYG